MMPNKLSPASQALIKKLFKVCDLSKKDMYIPDINQQANSLFSAGKYNQSLEYYQLSAEFSPNQPGAWNNLGNNYLMLNNLPKAFQCFQKVIALDKNDFNCLMNIGNCYYTWNQLDLATEYYLKALVVKESIPPLKSLGNVYKQKGKFDRALVFLEKCLQIDPNNLQVLIDVAMLSLILEKTEKGVSYLKKVLQKDPTNQMALMVMLKLKQQKKI